jgi:hypothetical protein
MRILITLLSLFWAFLLFMTGARFLILLFNIDRGNEFVDWILRHSDFWVKPFFNLLDLSNKAVDRTGGVFEPASAIAFVVYLVVGAIILNLLRSALVGYGGGLGSRWGHWRGV